jgi:hypothetical protein
MAKEPTHGAPPPAAATRDEIDQAIEALTLSQLVKLKKYAAWRTRGLGRASLGRDAEVLLQEALTSTIVGAEGTGEGRRWNKNVDFIKHLTEAMRSISDHWKTQFDEREPFLESEVVTVTGEGEEYSPLAAVPSEDPPAERALLAKEKVRQVFDLFTEDNEAILVLEGWVEGMTGPEIMEFGLTKQQYEATVKRIRYAVERMKN